ncbi:DUF3375 domain-containing protein [Agromyces archimandritae]|uniref:DUF3375 domain-containing protein n=1 Tax=Agromyces archimandritae TaxID=2781962 RepID=A0A975FMQ7_9MICO|nr:DUF3375 domain-containing protein [Agromyces archimandritae]QTX04959.1 DUF3375 domain-containing protein [Agromyces archimandritae]
MDLHELERLRERHPAWRLVRMRNAPLVLSFLGAHFIEANRGATPASELVAELDDVLYAVRRSEPNRYPSTPGEYLDEWSAPERGILRRFYPVGSEEVHYDATPAFEKAYRWVEGLQARAFVGTESRLQTLVELLRQLVHGSETDPEARIAELERRREAIEAELAEARVGRFPVLDATARRERYQQFSGTARELLSDFREVEDNFRRLDRSARERIARWEGGKGELLDELVGGRSDIASSDQGRSFQAFSDFLRSEARQDELVDLLAEVQSMADVGADRRIGRVHHDWAEAAERTQATVRSLSEQFRRFLDEQVWVENRRVLDLVRGIEASAIAVRADPPRGEVIGLDVDEAGLPIALPFERPLYDAKPAVEVDSLIGPADAHELELDALLSQHIVDTGRLAENIRAIVPRRSSVALEAVIEFYPIEQGVAEVLGYLSLDLDDIEVGTGEGESVIDYRDAAGVARRVRMPKVTVTRR